MPAEAQAKHGRRQKRREVQKGPLAAGGCTSSRWLVEVQNSTTAHAGTSGRCSVKLVGNLGESEELVLNGGGGVKSGELVAMETFVAADIGDLAYIELKNASAETWRPHWIKVCTPGGQEHFVYSRQWVAKNRTQKAYVEVAGAVGLRALPKPAAGKAD